MSKYALVLGAGGFIGSHMVRRLKAEGMIVIAADMKLPDFSKSIADEFYLGDLRERSFVSQVIKKYLYSEVYQFAADMGGAGFIFTGDNDASIMHNSSSVNLNVLEEIKHRGSDVKVFFSSSACIYPAQNQENPESPNCAEDSAYPANPDSEYGWEKLFSERLYLSYRKNYGLNSRIARYHNIFGPEGTWQGGREKAPAAICRKVILSADEIEVWGDGNQTRSFLYIDECIEATRRLMKSDFVGPVNIGSEEMISINNLVVMASEFEHKTLKIKHIQGPLGVRGRNSDNRLIREKLNWDYSLSLRNGLEKTYFWIKNQINLSDGNNS